MEQERQRTWSEQDSQDFIDFGRYFVPERELQIRTICDLIPPREEQVHVLELSCGEGLLAQALLDRFPNMTMHCYDSSPQMLGRTQARLSGYKGRYTLETFNLTASDWRTADRPLHAIVSSLAIHHLDDQQKQALYRDLYTMLVPGGVLVVADVVQPAHPLATGLAANLWDEAVRERALELDGHTAAYEFFREDRWNIYHHPDPMDKPSRVFDQLKWLEQAGFANVDVYWLQAGHAIFGGRKHG